MKELIRFLKNQDALRASGFGPIGWYNGMLVWQKDPKEPSATRILDLTSETLSRIFPLDEINAVLL